MMSPRAWDGLYTLQLSEILVFSGEENIALRQPVDVSSTKATSGPGWNKKFLVDGFVPYLMDAASGEQSVAFVSQIGIGNTPFLTMDLGEVEQLDRIHYHAIDLSDTVPQAIPDDFGVPGKILLEGANQSDFSDAKPMVQIRLDSIYDKGAIIMRRFPAIACRYVRLTASDPYIFRHPRITGTQFGAAEIEFFADGRNVAYGRTFEADFPAGGPPRLFAALTDGRNLYGEILATRNWLNQLAKRHDLEVERPMIIAELDRRYSRQRANLDKLGWLVAFLAVGIVFTILIDRIIRMRQIARIRVRLAADLHDELGANLHTIGLLGDLISGARDSPEEIDTLSRRIRSETDRSSIAVRHCSNMLAAKELYQDILAEMQRASNRIMARLEHEILIEGEEHIKALAPRTRADLFLFYKECLINISRHSGASKYTTELKATAKEIHLKISDNGRGLDTSEKKKVPSSLKRRSKLLGATVKVGSPPEGGTHIELNLRTRIWGIKRK
ncbi:sensor histidine kinase [Haloferula sp.]|uniref:sensor histidine kinase n=1 Tax=Haloferula sp. TaxID=2497595 RepID=UPI003C7626FC